MMNLLKEISTQKVDLKNSDGSDAGKNDVTNKVKTSDVGFSSMRNTINSDGEVTGSDVANYLERAADLNDEVETVPFGLETDDGDIVKVYVNAEQADAFEEEMKKLLGVEDDIEEAINKLAQDFDIIDVVWPKDKDEEGEDDEKHETADSDFDALSDEEEEEPMDVVGEYDPLEESLEESLKDIPTSWKKVGVRITFDDAEKVAKDLGTNFTKAEWYKLMTKFEGYSAMVFNELVFKAIKKLIKESLEEGADADRQRWEITYDIFGSNKEVPLYTNTRVFYGDSKEEVIKSHQKLIGGKITKVEKVSEGILDIFKKKPEPAKPKRLDITEEQRDMIRKNFSDHNADVKYSKEQEGSIYVLPKNITANAGTGRFAFTNEDGKLMVSVGWHRSKEDRMNPRVSPMIHTDHEIKTEQDLKDLIKQAN